MDEKIEAFKSHVRELAANPKFVHHKWFVKWHLEVVARIASELQQHYPETDKNLIEVLAWLHDYGKILDFDQQYDRNLLNIGRDKLVELGFEESFADKAAAYIEWMDKKLEVDLHEAPIEVQIVSSADGCSHFFSPFMYMWWYENADKPFEELMEGNNRKATSDWTNKIVLPEAQEVCKKFYEVTLVQNGNLPDIFLQ